MADEVWWLPGDWAVGDVVQITRGEEIVMRGRITEALGNSIYKVDVELGGVRARLRPGGLGR